MSKIQSIISSHATAYITSHHTSFQQVKAINAIASCRTSNLGSHTLSCECGHSKIVSNSCSNRHCPTCGGFSKELWVQKQQASLLPSHYFHLVFTVPDSVRQLIFFNQELLYQLMSDEFMRRFLLRVLPHKFVKIWHYSFLSNRFRSAKVALCLKLIGKEKLCCPECGRYFIHNREVNIN